MIWLFAIATVSLLAIGLLTGFANLGTEPIGIQFHDTYIVLSLGQMFSLLFLNLAFWTYIVRQVKNRFKRQSSNVVLLVVTGLLILATSLTIKFVGAMDQGWIVYPPLSALPDGIPEQDTITSKINYFLQGYQLFQIGVLGFIGIKIGGVMQKHGA